MTDLIARLEAAPEGSRELSDEVLLAVGWEHIDTGDVREEQWVSPGGMYFIVSPRPDPTRSIDDALKWMVPEGWSVANLWQAFKSKPTNQPWWGAKLRRDEPYYFIPPSVLGRPTPALAITIAALKAKEATQQTRPSP